MMDFQLDADDEFLLFDTLPDLIAKALINHNTDRVFARIENNYRMVPVAIGDDNAVQYVRASKDDFKRLAEIEPKLLVHSAYNLLKSTWRTTLSGRVRILDRVTLTPAQLPVSGEPQLAHHTPWQDQIVRLVDLNRIAAEHGLRFKLKVPKPSRSNEISSGSGTHFKRKREAVIEAAGKILEDDRAKFTKNGRPNASAIARQLNDQAQTYFKLKDPPLSIDGMTKLLREQIKNGKFTGD